MRWIVFTLGFFIRNLCYWRLYITSSTVYSISIYSILQFAIFSFLAGVKKCRIPRKRAYTFKKRIPRKGTKKSVKSIKQVKKALKPVPKKEETKKVDSNESASEGEDGANLSQDDSQNEEEGTEYLDSLMAASTTIG